MKTKIFFLVVLLFLGLGICKAVNIFSPTSLLLDQIKFDNHNVKLVLRKDNLLLVDNKSISIVKEEFVLDKMSIDTPQIMLFNDVILIYFYWKTNKIGSLVEFWIYNPKDKSIEKIFDIDQRITSDYILEDDIITIEKLNYSEKVLVKDEFKAYVKDTGFLDITPTISFSIDSKNELVTRRIIFTGAADWIENSNLFTYYSYEKNKLVFKKHQLK